MGMVSEMKGEGMLGMYKGQATVTIKHSVKLSFIVCVLEMMRLDLFHSHFKSQATGDMTRN